MRTKKLTPLAAFQDNIADAEALLTYARAFPNKRLRRMRKELRERVGEALKVPLGKRAALDCLENEYLFVVFNPDGGLGRDRFEDLRPLLRQGIVAACAALETYVADKAMEFVGLALKADPLPRRLREMTLTVGNWIDIETGYDRRAWGIRAVVEETIRKTSSSAPNRIGEVLSIVGVQGWAAKVDSARKIKSGSTVKDLEELTDRRNRIAHAADRKGQGRSAIDVSEAQRHIDLIKAVVDAIEFVLKTHKIF